MGFFFSPLPITSPSETPPIRVALFNIACPICGLWYSCHDHMCAECGHSYHPWCLARCSFLQRKCFISDCQVEFGDVWCIVWGIRPRVVENLGSGSERHASKKARRPTTQLSSLIAFSYDRGGSSSGSGESTPCKITSTPQPSTPSRQLS